MQQVSTHKNIHTLVHDIYQMLEKDHVPNDLITSATSLATDVSDGVLRSLRRQFPGAIERTPEEEVQLQRRGLRLSGLGPRCERVLWYQCHHPELGEALPPWAKIKFAYGDIIESLVLYLIKLAGHEVTGEQDELILEGIHGHRDGVVDGCVCDIKSCSSRMFQKYKTGSIALDDPFGALAQLDGYTLASAEDPLVRVKNKGYIIAVDKTLGHLHVYEHQTRPDYIRDRIEACKRIVGRSQPPDCTCGTKPFGRSGNIALDTQASYSSFKHLCFPGLRTFLYADGPVFLSKVVKTPDVTEVNREGKIVYAL